MRRFVTQENLSETVLSLNSLTKAVVSLDTETTGLKWKDGMFSLQLAIQFGDSYYFNFNNYSEPEKALDRAVLHTLKQLWLNPKIRWVIANAKFDMRRLEIDGILLGGEIYDVLLMAKIEYNKHMSYSLDSCLKRIGHSKNDLVSLYIKDNKLHTSYNVTGKKLKEKDLHYDRVPLDLMVEYGFDDVEANLILYEYQIKYFEAPENKEQIDLVHSNIELIKTVYAMESRGVCVDVEYCTEMIAVCEGTTSQILREIEELVGRPYKAGPIWLTEALKEQGIDVTMSLKGNAELGHTELEGMNNALASLVSKLRELEKELGFYYTLKRFQVDGVIHTNYRLNGTDTGRFSSNEPNMQQIPKDESGKGGTVRGAFKPREGFMFLSIDYDQMEYRIMADYAGEMGMIAAIKGGLDPHTYVANMMGVNRKLAKTLNFGLLYGMGIGKLSEALNTDTATAKQLKAKYYRELPNVMRLTQEVMSVASSRGYIKNKYNRRMYLNDDNFAYKMPNYLIQGTGADVVRTAMNKVNFFLEGCKSKMVLTIHDEIIIELHKSEAHLVPEIVRIMEEEYQPINGMNLTCGCEFSETSWETSTFKPWSEYV